MERNQTDILSEPVRIAHIMGKLCAGGVEAVVYNYYKEIDKTKFQFDFYYDADSTVEPPADLIAMGARFFKIPPYQKVSDYQKVIRGYFRENHYEIVHSHINTLSVFPLYAAWREKIPVRIAHNHSVPGGREWKRNALKYTLRLFAKVFPTDYFSCSEKAGRWLFGNRTFDEGRVYVVKNAIDFSRFCPDETQRTSLRHQLGIENDFVVGHVGRFTFAKNHIFLINIFNEICRRKPSGKLVLVGDGEEHDSIVAEINRLNLQDRVIFVGKTAEAYKYYRVFDVMILPSLYEGLSMAAVESQACGCPALVSTVVPEEAIISNGCRYLSLEEPADKWAEEALKVSEIQVKLDERADSYRIEKAVKDLEQKYKELLERRCGIV